MNSILSFLSSSIRNALAILLSVLGSALAMPASADTVTYYHNDLLGTPIAASDATGKVIWRRAYDPFGAQVASTASTSNVRIDYTGHTKDAETGLVNMGARMYNPEIGMFYGIDQAAIDPHNEFSFNRYAYANQNPYRYVDPDGRNAVDYFVVVGLIYGVTVAVTSIYGNPDVQTAVNGVLSTASDLVGRGHAQLNENHDQPKDDAAEPQPGTEESDYGCIYLCDGTSEGQETPSGLPYVGSANNMKKRAKNANDGRNRDNAQIIGKFRKGDSTEKANNEQNGMNANGGVKKLDNRRNEVAPNKWSKRNIKPPVE